MRTGEHMDDADCCCSVQDDDGKRDRTLSGVYDVVAAGAAVIEVDEDEDEAEASRNNGRNGERRGILS